MESRAATQMRRHASMSMIFINYRRRDGAYAAAFLDDALSREFGSEHIFRAGRSIRPGENYEQCIVSAIESSNAMLVLIDPDWVNSFKTAQLDMNWVHREVREALVREVPVVPVLLAGTSRLSEDCLPPDIATLARLQYLRFDYRSTIQDLAYIANEIRRSVPDLAKSTLRAALARRLFKAISTATQASGPKSGS